MSAWRWAALVVVLIGASLFALAVGTVRIPVLEVWHILVRGGDSMPAMIVRNLRAPRVALAILVGAGLGMSGAALQGTMRNPLAEPYLLGVSGGAAVGAVLATAAGLG